MNHRLFSSFPPFTWGLISGLRITAPSHQPEPCCLVPSKPTGCDPNTLLLDHWLKSFSLSHSTECVGIIQEDTPLLLFLPRLASGKRSLPAMRLTAHIHPSAILFLTLSSLASAGKHCYPCNPSSLSWAFGITGQEWVNVAWRCMSHLYHMFRLPYEDEGKAENFWGVF